MATVNFSVPDEVKASFNETFVGTNKSRVIADLMIRAVEEVRVQRRRRTAHERLLALRAEGRIATEDEVRGARHEGRP